MVIVDDKINNDKQMHLIHRPFWWPRRCTGAIQMALPDAACPGLFRKPLDAAIGWLHPTYCPSGLQGNRQTNNNQQIHLKRWPFLLGRCRHCSGNYKAWGASGGKYEAWIVILAAVDRFFWISRKAESHQGKLKSHWRKRKAIEESRKPLKKVGKPLRKIGFRARKIGFQEGKISIFPKRFSSNWQFWRLVFLRNLLPRVRTDFLCWTQVLTTKIKSS